MRKMLETVVVLNLILAMASSGCAIVVIGAAGVAGGYAVSGDGIEGVSTKSYDHVWQRASDVLKQQGTIKVADKKAGKIIAQVGNSEVKFKLDQATPNTVIVRVQARRLAGMFPDMNLSKRIYSMIVKGRG